MKNYIAFILIQCLLLLSNCEENDQKKTDSTVNKATKENDTTTSSDIVLINSAMNCSDGEIMIDEPLESLNLTINFVEGEEYCGFVFTQTRNESFLKVEIQDLTLPTDVTLTLFYNSTAREDREKDEPSSQHFYTFNPKSNIANAHITLLGNKFDIRYKGLSGSPLQISLQLQELPKAKERSIVILDDKKTSMELRTLNGYGGYIKNSVMKIFLKGKSDLDLDTSYLLITVKKLILDSAAGDFLTIGSGNQSNIFLGPSSIVLRKSVSNPITFKVVNRDAYIIFTAMLSDKNNANFEIDFDRLGIGLITEPAILVTAAPQTSAELQALPLCFNKIRTGTITCNNFTSSNMLNDFKSAMAEFTQRYVDENRIILPTSGGIRSDDIIVYCYFHNDSRKIEENYLTFAVVSPLDKDRAVLSKSQLGEIIKKYRIEISRMLKFAYEVRECELRPNYWVWFWGCVGFFVISVLVLAGTWYCSTRDVFHFDFMKIIDKSETDKGFDADNHTVNPAFQEDDNLYVKQQTPFQYIDDQEIDTGNPDLFVGQEELPKVAFSNYFRGAKDPMLFRQKSDSQLVQKKTPFLKRQNSDHYSTYPSKPLQTYTPVGTQISDTMSNRPAIDVPNEPLPHEINFYKGPSDNLKDGLHIPSILRSSAIGDVVRLTEESETDPNHIYEDPRDVKNQLVLEGYSDEDETKL